MAGQKAKALVQSELSAQNIMFTQCPLPYPIHSGIRIISRSAKLHDCVSGAHIYELLLRLNARSSPSSQWRTSPNTGSPRLNMGSPRNTHRIPRQCPPPLRRRSTQRHPPTQRHSSNSSNPPTVEEARPPLRPPPRLTSSPVQPLPPRTLSSSSSPAATEHRPLGLPPTNSSPCNSSSLSGATAPRPLVPHTSSSRRRPPDPPISRRHRPCSNSSSRLLTAPGPRGVHRRGPRAQTPASQR